MEQRGPFYKRKIALSFERTFEEIEKRKKKTYDYRYLKLKRDVDLGIFGFNHLRRKGICISN
jgi:hypothetical protein